MNKLRGHLLPPFLMLALVLLALPAAAQQAVEITPADDLQLLQILERKLEGEKKDGKSENPEPVPENVETHWGAALGVVQIPDYPSAEQGRLHYLVIPTYKGKHFTIDRQDGVKGELVDESSLKISFSFLFLFPTKSEDIPARHGMPDLKWNLQLGPEGQIFLARSFFHTMFIRIPLRFVATTDFYHEFEYRDWTFTPGLRNIFYLGEGRGEITTRFDVEWSSERYNDLFFEVDAKYATATRPAYNARSGFLEYVAGINYAYYDSFPWTYFVGSNVYFLNNSVNRDSPLFKRDTGVSVFGGIIRYF